ncbi:hypothetical protein OKA04_05445 [Luteolibacter flavescens]|uniref:Uncharacterized protein n=1 Tax=Luteolibacter flavescens TaxID=1859460 RepID=A0ABT3FKS9_9BACT|nr:hypothetical protein [Luteolibacter flavescens]MCW1884165.1 hypothetical protein [Luteolibacter flavescens]
MKTIAAILLTLSVPVLAQTPAPAPPPVAKPAASPSLKAQLAKSPLSGIIIPEVVFDKATVDDAITALTNLVDTQTKGGVKLQWIDKAFDRKKWSPTVTITAKGFSAGKLMTEILDQAGLEARLEEHAIVLSPKTRVVERRVIPAEKTEAPKLDGGSTHRDQFRDPLKRK